MVDIFPFKAQQRMNNICKNNYFFTITQRATPFLFGAALDWQFLYFCINLQSYIYLHDSSPVR